MIPRPTLRTHSPFPAVAAGSFPIIFPQGHQSSEEKGIPIFFLHMPLLEQHQDTKYGRTPEGTDWENQKRWKQHRQNRAHWAYKTERFYQAVLLQSAFYI